MTRVDFYSNVQDRRGFAARLLEKVIAAEQTVVVYHHDAASLNELDEYLWAYSEESFLPHCLANDEAASESPILLASSADELPATHMAVLLNLSDETCPFFSRFERCLEVVSNDDADKTTARARYKFYKDRGYPLNNHNMAGK